MSPVLAAGFIDREKKTVACPLHGWIYHIPTGRLLGTSGIDADMGCPLKVYAVKVVDEDVWIDPSPSLSPFRGEEQIQNFSSPLKGERSGEGSDPIDD